MNEKQLLVEMKQFDKDSELMDRSMATLKKNFKDRFIAFKNGTVVGEGCSFNELKEHTKEKKIDLGTCVIQFIQEKDILYIL